MPLFPGPDCKFNFNNAEPRKEGGGRASAVRSRVEGNLLVYDGGKTPGWDLTSDKIKITGIQSNR